ncbi:MAG: hypothetical protein IPK00_08055 [Deltaproteobacteria bacterium]|nr:hypothetical protein [Deltaproteobacteria bacterium]
MSDREAIATVRKPGHRLWVARELEAVVEALGFGDALTFRAALADGRLVEGGRAPHRLLALPGRVERLRVRPARRGGVFGGLLGGRYLSPERAPRELALWLSLRRRGVPLPTPVAAIASRRGGLWSCHFAALEREGARDGRAWLAAAPSPRALRLAALAFARALRRLHDAGVVHGDLNLRNLLIEGEGDALACLFVDLDHARARAVVSPRDRLAELARLARSLEKLGLADRVDARLRARVVVAYCGSDRTLRRALLASQGREQRRLARHRIAWRAARILGT